MLDTTTKQKSRTKKEDRAVAFHEAGHAAIALVLGCDDVDANIDVANPHGVAGVSNFGWRAVGFGNNEHHYPSNSAEAHLERAEEDEFLRPDDDVYHKVECLAVIAMAGTMAEKKSRNVPSRKSDIPDFSDMLMMEQCIGSLGHGRDNDITKAHTKYLRVLARELIDEYWTLIEEIANTLLRVRSIDENEMWAVYQKWREARNEATRRQAKKMGFSPDAFKQY